MADMDQKDEKTSISATKDVPPSSSENGEVWLSHDELDMARMGITQELKRNFGWLSSVGFTSCTMGT